MRKRRYDSAGESGLCRLGVNFFIGSLIMNILGICGSLRQQSLNRHSLHAAARLMPGGMNFQMAEIGDIPFYSQDIEVAGMPTAVTRLGAQIAQADGVLIASPEYNFSMTGALKNALDWMSRLKPAPLKDKPVAILSATGGPVGGARNQYELRRVLGCLEALVLMRPEVFIGLADSKFDAQGQLTDEASAKVLAAQMSAFEAWIRRMGPKA